MDDFRLILNYRGEMIEAYLHTIKLNHHFSYIYENDFYGTAGSLSLVNTIENDTFFYLRRCFVGMTARSFVKLLHASDAFILVAFYPFIGGGPGDLKLSAQFCDGKLA